MPRLAETISQKKLDANRCNASKSTGPRSDEGKRTVSRNALRHGMFSQQVVLPGEDVEEFNQLRRDSIRKFNPRDGVELRLVEQIVAALWKLERLQGVELRLYKAKTEALNQQATAPITSEIKRSEAYVAWAHETIKDGDTPEIRQHLAGCQQQLDRQQKQLAAVQPVPGDQVLAAMFQSDDASLDRVHRYVYRLENSLNRAMRQLRELQKAPADIEPNEFTSELLESEPEEKSPEPENENGGTNPPLADPLAGPEDTRSAAAALPPLPVLRERDGVRVRSESGNDLPIAATPSPAPSPGVPGEARKGNLETADDAHTLCPGDASTESSA
jgi:hypothetical protein